LKIAESTTMNSWKDILKKSCASRHLVA